MNIVAVTPDRDQYILPLSKHLRYPLVFLRTLNWEDLILLKPAAVVFLGDWLFEHEQLIINCRKSNIPTILLMDGTIEWKHFFENPKWSYGGNEAPYFPVQCDKVFVPGASTYRFLEFFGNYSKCEIVGFPRFDHYQSVLFDKRLSNQNKVIGVMSGNTAGYTKEQIDQSKQLFEDLFRYFKQNNKVEVKWRLRKGFESLLDVTIKNENTGTLVEFLQEVDAVICQPSTAAYESMMFGLPTAIADYSIAPNYMHSAWEIKNREHIDPIIESLINPEPIKKIYQQQLLEDTVAFKGNSAMVAANIINEMISLKIKLPDVEFPPNLFLKFLENQTTCVFYVDSLFPNQTAYRYTELNLLKEAYTKLERKTYRLIKDTQRRNIGFWFDRVISKIIK